MTEKEKLESLIAEGFRTHMTIRTITDDEKLNKLPKPYWDKDVYAVPLWKESGEKLMFYYVNRDTMDYAKQLVEVEREIAGYDLCVYCSIVGSDAVNGKEPDMRNIIESLKKFKNWNVSESTCANVFEVHFEIEGDDRDQITHFINEVKDVALLLSLKNQLGFSVVYHSKGPKYRAQPFSMKLGIPRSILKGLDEADITQCKNILCSPECTQAAKALRLLYSQITSESKIIIGWSTIEEIFGSPPEHMLTKYEINDVVSKVENIEINGAVSQRLVDIVKNPDFLSKKSRNDRIANNISEAVNEDAAAILSSVKALSKVRGKIAHTFDASEEELLSHISFIEKSLVGYLQKHGANINA